MKEHALTVRPHYGQTDQMGIVYHGNFLHFFEMGRTELLRAAGFPYTELEKRGLYLMVTEAFCRYRSGARYDEPLRLETRVAGIKPASVRFEYTVRGEDGRLIAEANTELACVDGKRKPQRLPEDVIARLQ